MRDTVRVSGPPQRAPAEEVRSEFARLRRERDEAVRRYQRLLHGLEFVGVVAIAVLFWYSVAQ